MGLTLREFNALAVQERYFYEIRDENGERYCHCGSEKDRDLLLSHHPTFTAHKFALPLPPPVVNVNAVEVEMERALPESEAVPLEL